MYTAKEIALSSSLSFGVSYDRVFNFINNAERDGFLSSYKVGKNRFFNAGAALAAAIGTVGFVKRDAALFDYCNKNASDIFASGRFFVFGVGLDRHFDVQLSSSHPVRTEICLKGFIACLNE